MSSLGRDDNRVPVMGALTNDGSLTPTSLRLDPTTKRLIVNAVINGLTLQNDGSVPVTVVAGGTGGGAVTVIDGGDVAEGATTDAAVTAGSTGTVSGKLRQISADVSSVKTNTTSIATAAKQDTGNTSVASIDTKTPALGQALAAGSVPVILPSATITTLTPPTTIGSSTATGSAVPANAFYNGVNAQTALPTAASAGNLTGATADKFGRTVVLPGGMRDIIGSQRTTISASTAETTIVTSAASVFNDIFLLTIRNTSATAVRVDIRDTTLGTIIDDVYVPAGDMRGWAVPQGVVPQTTVNTNWTAQCSASVTDVRITAWFFKNK